MSETTTKVKSALEIAQESALAELRKLGGEMLREDSVIFQGKKFILPEGTTIENAIKFLKHVQAEEGEFAQWQRIYPYRPADGQVATMRALEQAFGATKHSGSFGFFGPNPPRFVHVHVSPFEQIQVPNLGDSIEVPALPGVTLTLSVVEDEDEGLQFALIAGGPKGRRYEIEGLFNLVETELRERSIYKGQAIDAGFNFVDLSLVNPDQVVYSEETLRALNRSVWAPIKHESRLVRDGIKLKGASLLFGEFGTGKTLAAYLTGQHATEAGWTFILCEPRHDLFDALKAAKQYAPAVVFYEDVDVLTADADAERIQTILDAFDGAKSKGQPVRVVLTTNHAEKIHKGLLRPGRIDAAIEIGKPDAGAVRRLVELRTPHLDPEITDEAWEAVTDAMEGYLPAFIAEASDRAYMDALIRAEEMGGEIQVGSDDLRIAAGGLRQQLDLMQGGTDTKDTDTLQAAVQRAIKPVAETAVAETIVEMLDPRLVVGKANGKS